MTKHHTTKQQASKQHGQKSPASKQHDHEAVRYEIARVKKSTASEQHNNKTAHYKLAHDETVQPQKKKKEISTKKYNLEMAQRKTIMPQYS